MAEATVINCPHCGQAYRMSPENMVRFAGRAMTCKKCQQPFTVPEQQDEAPVEQEQHEEHQQHEQQEMVADAQAVAGTDEAEEQTDFANEPPDLSSVQMPAAPAAPPMPSSPPPPVQQPSPSPPYMAPARQSAATAGAFSEYLSFKKFLTPVIIQVLFWAGAAGTVLTGILTIIHASDLPDVRGIGTLRTSSIFSGLMWMLIGPLVMRAFCDVAMAIFGIHDCLQAARGKQQP